MNLKLGSSPAELLSGKKLVECLNKGFSMDVELSYLECIQKVFEQLPILESIMKRGDSYYGFGFLMEVDATIDFSMKDFEEFKKHKILGKFFEMNMDSILAQFGLS